MMLIAASIGIRSGTGDSLRSSMYGLLTVALTVALILNASCSAQGADGSGPFVAGFDRFASHGDIERLSAGRLLISELSCTSCHPRPADDLSSLSKGGPRLDGAAVRLQPQWLEAYIADPHSVSPGATMPDVLGGRSKQERQAIAKSITAFLSTQQKPPNEVKGSGLLPVPHEFWNKGDPARGQLLYHSTGCVACHAVGQEQSVAPGSSALDQLIQDLDADELAAMGLAAAAREVHSVPFSDLKAKYSAFGLTHFLFEPTQSRPTSRMPSLKLAPVEAADIASYLLKDQLPHSVAWTVDPAEIEKGKRLFVDLNCIQCHVASDLKSRSVAKPLRELELEAAQQCLTNNSDFPIRYRLDALQADSIRIAIHALQNTSKLSAQEQLEHEMLVFNCYACHERNGRGGVARFRRDHFETIAKVDLGDEGRLPPPLTGVGRKLQPTWLKNVLLGKKGDIRPHMRIRMPQFHSQLAERLPELLRIVDETDSPRESVAARRESINAQSQDAELIEAGRQLMDVGCVQCHAFNGSALPGVIGVDLRNISNRVQPEWFRDFVLNPGAIKARTRMPSFFPEGKSQRPDLLAGDFDRQTAAMWAYLNSKNQFELPEKIKQARATNYELRPTEKPIVLRTFMNEAGTHAIAVGFAQQVHYAFNAESLLLSVGWRGKFLDSQGTWFVRFAPPASPLGEKVIAFPNSFLLAHLQSPADAWPSLANNHPLSPTPTFLGYRLNSAGVPILEYKFGDIKVEDYIEPIQGDDGPGLRRKLTLTNQAPAKQAPETTRATRVWLLAAMGKKLTRITEQSVANENGLRTTLKDVVGQVRTNAGRDEWLLPLEFEKSFNVELQYQW